MDEWNLTLSQKRQKSGKQCEEFLTFPIDMGTRLMYMKSKSSVRKNVTWMRKHVGKKFVKNSRTKILR